MIVRVPGDKSLTQRALILASLAEGRSRLEGLLGGEDPRSTASALRALGAEIPTVPADGSEILVRGLGLRGLRAPSGPLDLGNSGTGVRLLLGVLAGQRFEAVVTGDASLRSRPMARVTDPLGAMGAHFEELDEPGRLPIRVRGSSLRPLEYDLPVASAQVKSALLLAGLVSNASVRLSEPGRSRDHTERMLRLMGASVEERERERCWVVELTDSPTLIRPLDFLVPGDFSSAAFLIVLGALGGAGPALTVEGVGLNPTRTGLLTILRRMGARIDVSRRPGAVPDSARDGAAVGEPTGDVTVGAVDLVGIDVGAEEVLSAIDEIPALVCAAVRARGTTRVTGARELRVKESDRVRALVDGLRALGVEAEELDDGLVLEGTERPLVGTVEARMDHRIAMAFGVLGALPGNRIEVLGASVVDVSFPGFWDLLSALSGGGRSRAVPRQGRPRFGPLVTLDGPAGSGKSTTARAVARRLGFRHLDSGALYRALTLALLRDSVPPEQWASLDPAELERRRIGVRPGPGTEMVITLNGEPLDDEDLRGSEVTAHVSALSSLPFVRDWLLERQREAAHGGPLVAEGRDMGTVVFPDAEVKVFVTARLEERAKRRLLDQGVGDPAVSEVRHEAERLAERDARDEGRVHSPLRRPDGALVLDTTELTFEEQVDAIVALAKTRLDAPQAPE